MTSRRTAGLAVSTAAALLAIPAAAQAVTLTPSKGCYTNVPTRGGEPLVTTLTGGTPGGRFQVAATVPGKGTGSAGSISGNFDAAGNAVAAIPNPGMPRTTIDPSEGQTLRLSVQDYGSGAPAVEAGAVKITTLAIDVSSRPRSPRRRRSVRVSGGPFAGQTLYGFVVKPNGRRVLRRVRLGRTNGCGYVSHRSVVAPRSFRRGNYRFYVNAGRTLRKSRAIYTSFSIGRRF